ncbi:hypothetical protein [Mesorhizobium japonicum]|uniref:hypothetical protein n=1 Tax=Mesorhizobium japonicum TaxID=2066070 RepID=UPI0012FEF261|nr:hypothetical protein [Mesorhizobium japonicum]
MNNLEVSSTEKKRIDKVILASISKSWDDFKRLSDEPFSNEKSMLEQFQYSSKWIRQSRESLNKSIKMTLLEDGGRLIYTMLKSKNGTNIILTMHSTDDSELSIISIWSFFQELDINSLFDS